MTVKMGLEVTVVKEYRLTQVYDDITCVHTQQQKLRIKQWGWTRKGIKLQIKFLSGISTNNIYSLFMWHALTIAKLQMSVKMCLFNLI